MDQQRKVFINYHREDVSTQAMILYDRLRNRVGAANIFMDVVSADGEPGR